MSTASPPARVLALLLCLSFPAAVAQDWPAFRGADSTGVSHEEGLPTRWSTEQNVAWSVP